MSFCHTLCYAFTGRKIRANVLVPVLSRLLHIGSHSLDPFSKVIAICVFYIVLSSSPLGATGFFSESLREKKALMRTLHLCGASLLLAPLRMLLNQHLTLHPSLPTTTWLVLGVKRVALPTVCRISVGATDTGYVPVLSRLCGLQLLLGAA